MSAHVSKFTLSVVAIILFFLVIVATFLNPINGHQVDFPFFSVFYRVGAVIALGSGIIIFLKISKKDHSWWIYPISVILLLLQLFFVLNFQRPIYTDTGYVYSMAERLANGNYNWFRYFTIYPNNANITIVWAWIFKFCHVLGIDNTLNIFASVQLIFLDASVFFFSWAVYLWQKTIGKIVTLVSLAYLPMFMYIVLPYNDVFAVSLLLVTLGFFVLLIKTETAKHKFFLSLGMFFSLSIAVGIRQNLIIILIALILTLLFLNQLSFRFRGVLIGVGVFICLLTNAGFKEIQQAYHYHPEPQQATPAVTWINMSWNPHTSGQIDVGDAWHWAELPKKERATKLNQELVQRLKEAGPLGIIKHLVKKTAFMFSIGFPYQDMDGLRFKNSSYNQWQVPRILNSISNLFQPVYIWLLILALYSPLVLLKKKLGEYKIYLPVVLFSSFSITGVFIFQIFLWEVRDRYALPMVPFIILLAAISISILKRQMTRNTDSKNLINRKHLVWINFIALICLGVGWITQLHNFSNKSVQTGTVVTSGFPLYAELMNYQYPGYTVLQTEPFKIKKGPAVMQISLGRLSEKQREKLKLTLTDIQTKQRSIIPLKSDEINFKHNFDGGLYDLELVNSSESSSAPGFINDMGVSQIQGPKVYSNGYQQPGVNLVFSVISQQEATKVPLLVYHSLFLLFTLLSMTVLLILRNRNYYH